MEELRHRKRYCYRILTMAKKKETTEETVLVFSEKIEAINMDFGREDLNKLRDTLNAVVAHVNNA